MLLFKQVQTSFYQICPPFVCFLPVLPPYPSPNCHHLPPECHQVLYGSFYGFYEITAGCFLAAPVREQIFSNATLAMLPLPTLPVKTLHCFPGALKKWSKLPYMAPHVWPLPFPAQSSAAPLIHDPFWSSSSSTSVLSITTCAGPSTWSDPLSLPYPSNSSVHSSGLKIKIPFFSWLSHLLCSLGSCPLS